MIVIATIGRNSTDTYTGCEDVGVGEHADFVDSNFGLGQFLTIDNYAVGFHWTQLLKFSGLSSIPAGSSIKAAVIFLRHQGGSINPATITFRRSLRNWKEFEATGRVYSVGNSWMSVMGLSNGTDRSSTISAAISVGLTAEYVAFSSAQLTADVQDMFANPSTNYGWSIERTDGADDGGYRYYSASEYADGLRPYLQITYLPPGKQVITQTLEHDYGSGLEECLDVRSSEPIVCSYGIEGNSPLDRIASSGVLEYLLDNSERNSEGRIGLYSLTHPFKKPGFDFNVPTRWTLTNGWHTSYKFRGKLGEIFPTPGKHEARDVRVQALDWMDDAAELDMPLLDAQFDKYGHELVEMILDALDADDQPVARDIQSSLETYAIALDGDTLGERPKVREVLNAIAMSGVDYGYVRGDTTQGGTFQWENRQHRTQAATIHIVLEDIHPGTMIVPGSKKDVYSSVKIASRPAEIDASPTTILYDLQSTSTFIAAGETNTALFGPYRDPASRDVIGGTDLQAPVANTTYIMNAAQDGSGANLTANFTVTPNFTGAGVGWTITNTGATGGYITRLRAIGKGIRRALTYVESPIVGSTYGARTFIFDMPYQSNLNVAKDTADYLALVLANPLVNVRSVTFLANLTAELSEHAILREPGDRIALVEDVTGINAEFSINNVRLEYVDKYQTWCTWGLAPILSSLDPWELGVSELGVSTVLGF